MLASVPAACPYPPEDIEIGVWLDKGYDIDEVYGMLRQNGYVPHIRILVRWEKKVANYLAMVHLASAFIAFKHAGLA